MQEGQIRALPYRAEPCCNRYERQKRDGKSQKLISDLRFQMSGSEDQGLAQTVNANGAHRRDRPSNSLTAQSPGSHPVPLPSG